MTVGQPRAGNKGESPTRAAPSARVTRQYDSPRRRAKADATRAMIATAAHALFAERGWAGTTMRDVAKRAGVAEPTVYAAYRSKAGLAHALVEAIEATADTDRQGADLAAAKDDPAGQLGAMIGFDRRLYEHGGDVLVVLREAGRSQPDLAEAYAAGREAADQLRHRILSTWSDDILRPGLDRDEAVDTYAALCNVDVYRVLTEERGWTPSRVEDWLHQTLCRLLLT